MFTEDELDFLDNFFGFLAGISTGDFGYAIACHAFCVSTETVESAT